MEPRPFQSPSIKISAEYGTKPKKIEDETGLGDCYISVLSSDLIENEISCNNIKKAGYYASAAASYLVEKKGPYGFKSKKMVENRIKDGNYIFSPFSKKIE